VLKYGKDYEAMEIDIRQCLSVSCVLSLLSTAVIRPDMVFILIVPRRVSAMRSVHIGPSNVNNNKCIYGTWLLQRVRVRVFTTEESGYGTWPLEGAFLFCFSLKFYLFFEVMVGWAVSARGCRILVGV